MTHHLDQVDPMPINNSEHESTNASLDNPQVPGQQPIRIVGAGEKAKPPSPVEKKISGMPKRKPKESSLTKKRKKKQNR